MTDSAILLWFMSNRNKWLCPSKDISKNVHSNIIHSNANCNPPKCPLVREWGNTLNYGGHSHVLPRSPVKVGFVAPTLRHAASRQPLGCQSLPELPQLQRADLLKAVFPGAAHIHATRLRPATLASELCVGLAEAVLGSARSSELLPVCSQSCFLSLLPQLPSQGHFLMTILLANLCLSVGFPENKHAVCGVFIQQNMVQQ